MVRLSTLVLMRYLSFEEAALRRLKGLTAGAHLHGHDHPLDDDGESSEDEIYTQPASKGNGAHSPNSALSGGAVLNMGEFLKQKHDAYKSPALIVLEGMMDFTHEQFQSNLGWIIPLLSRLIICEDVEVRVCVRQIYQSFVNFLLIK